MKSFVGNFINGSFSKKSVKTYSKRNPHNQKILFKVQDSRISDLDRAISSARVAFKSWSSLSPIIRGELLFKVSNAMISKKSVLAKCVATETGKSYKDAMGEVLGSIKQAQFFAGEGSRLYASSLTSSMSNKFSNLLRSPVGVAGLIIPANTPIANIAWKIFPALICGNTVVLKSAEDAPLISNMIAEIFKELNAPKGLINIIHGSGPVIGQSLVRNQNIPLISFTGSSPVGKDIASAAGKRLAKVSLELGGKNPFIIFEDADIDLAAKYACLSAFSNAGQRCAAASRILIQNSAYKTFISKFKSLTNKLILGTHPESDLGPVINLDQFNNIISCIKQAIDDGANVFQGGSDPKKLVGKGLYIKPTIIEGLDADHPIANQEIFGPVVTINKFKTLEESIMLANSSDYGLTSAVHTSNLDTALKVAQSIEFGLTNINGPTYGSEPHMPFGGFKESGNGSREPGTQAIDFYSELRNISIFYDQ